LDEIDEATDLEELTYTFSNLYASTQYEVKVVAKSNEFNTTSTQTTTVLTKDGPKPNDFTISLGEPTTGSVRVSWTSLTIDGGSGVYVNLYINNWEEATGWVSNGYLFTGLRPNTDYTIRVVAKSGKYRTTLAKEISFKTKAFPSTFEVTSAEISAGTSEFVSVIIRFSNRTLLDRIVLNNKTYNNYFYAGDTGITFSITDEEFDALNNAVVKEGDAYYSMNGKIVSIKFTYTN